MKCVRTLVLLVLIISVTIVMSACGRSEAAKSADGLIEAIGEVTKDSKGAITAAQNAVDALEQKDRDSLKYYNKLEKAKEEYQEILNVEAIENVQSLIAEIGTVTMDSGNVIKTAREAYNKLSKELQERVNNTDTLNNAETAFLKARAEFVEQAIDVIGEVSLGSGDTLKLTRGAYDDLPSEAKAMVSNEKVLAEAEKKYETLRIERVEDEISKIGKVTLDSGGDIERAEKAYDALGSLANKVSNKDVLTNAKSAYKELQKENALKKLAQFRVDTDEVNGVKFYMPKVYPEYANTRCYVLPYIGMKGNDIWLCATLNYTGDDWVFFKKVVFSIDGKNITKSFTYFDVIRDNGYGDVWEVINTADGEAYKDTFRSIAKSNKTIVRFEGDTYYDDFTVKATDKTAMTDILDAYEALLATGLYK